MLRSGSSEIGPPLGDGCDTITASETRYIYSPLSKPIRTRINSQTSICEHCESQTPRRTRTWCVHCMNMAYEDLDERQQGCCTAGKRLAGWVLLAKVFAIAALVLIGLAMAQKGLDWSENTMHFHPIMMSIGFLYLFADAMMIYRILPNTSRMTVKVLHMIIQALALGFAVTGVNCAFSGQFSSLHSWMGIVTVIIFCMQWLAGFVTFLFPGLSTPSKTAYRPLHVFWGVALFAMAGATMLLGAVKFDGNLFNAFGVMVIGAVITTSYVLVNEDFRRPSPAKDTEVFPIN